MGCLNGAGQRTVRHMVSAAGRNLSPVEIALAAVEDSEETEDADGTITPLDDVLLFAGGATARDVLEELARERRPLRSSPSSPCPVEAVEEAAALLAMTGGSVTIWNEAPCNGPS